MSYRVIFTPEAEEQLAALYRYIAEAASLAGKINRLVRALSGLQKKVDFKNISRFLAHIFC